VISSRTIPFARRVISKPRDHPIDHSHYHDVTAFRAAIWRCARAETKKEKFMRPLLTICVAAVLSLPAWAQEPLWITGAFGTQLLNVDPGTGAVTTIGATGYDGSVVLAFHPDGTLYTFTRSDTGDENVPEQFATFDLLTGQATLRGSALAQRAMMMPAAVGPDGTLYAAGIFGSLADKLLVIDLQTGQPTVVGPFGVSGIMDFAFDRSGTLWAANASGLYHIDTATGAATSVASFGGDLLGNTGSWGVMGLHFAPDGTLYATDFVIDTAGSLGSSLFTVDTATGVATRVAYLNLFMAHSADMRPPTPAQRTSDLAALIASYDLHGGTSQSLLAKLYAAGKAIEESRKQAACKMFGAFRNELRALSGRLTAAQSDQLDVDALWAETSLNCR
jgi:hypothetical protein